MTIAATGTERIGSRPATDNRPISILVVGGFFLLTEHTAHVFGALPWLLILACPLMHLFMHHGHGHHGGSDRQAEDRQ